QTRELIRTNSAASLRGPLLSSGLILISPATAAARSSMRLRQILDQRLQIVRRQRLETGGHDGKLRDVEARDVLALDDVFLRRGVKDLNSRLRLGFEPAGEGVAAFRRYVPETIVCFDRTVRIEDFHEDVAPVAC